ncbi:MAG TPA: hypothetical protein VEV15_13925 [Flavisolibacter sp.]|nr:hypothetical protein [Flavisolibacter sp.]
MNNLVTSLQHEGISQTTALATVQSLLRRAKEKYPKLSSFAAAVLIKKCLEEIYTDELSISPSEVLLV